MAQIARQGIVVLQGAFIVACLVMILLWPDWRVSLQAVVECEEDKHIDEYNYCVSRNADTPPKDDPGEGHEWVYRGDGVWVAECVECAEEITVTDGQDEYECDELVGTMREACDEQYFGTDDDPSPPDDPPSDDPPSDDPPDDPPSDDPPDDPPPPPPPSCASSAYQNVLDAYPPSSPPCQYIVYMRRFAEPESFGGGFVGDDRGPSTSLEATSRVSGSFIIGADGGGILLDVCSDPTGFNPTDGAATATPTARLINGSSADGTPSTIFTTAGANPLIPGSPDIDTRLDLQVGEGPNSIILSGTVSGDPFPSAEVFVVDTYGHSVMLTSFRTPIDPTTGPVTSLPGNQDVQLVNFKVYIPKGDDGLCR